MQIITNSKPRPMLALYELPPQAAKDFDYVKEDDGSYRFVKYKGAWYDVYDMQVISREQGFSQFSGWHGIASDTYFSGVLVRFVNDNDVIVGRYYS